MYYILFITQFDLSLNNQLYMIFYKNYRGVISNGIINQ